MEKKNDFCDFFCDFPAAGNNEKKNLIKVKNEKKNLTAENLMGYCPFVLQEQERRLWDCVAIQYFVL